MSTDDGEPEREPVYRPGGYAGPPTRDRGSSGALVLGIASLLCCGTFGLPFGVGAVITGATSRRRIAASGGLLHGQGNALAGIVLGSIGAALSLLLLVAFVTSPDLLREVRDALEPTTTTTSPAGGR